MRKKKCVECGVCRERNMRLKVKWSLMSITVLGALTPCGYIDKEKVVCEVVCELRGVSGAKQEFKVKRKRVAARKNKILRGE